MNLPSDFIQQTIKLMGESGFNALQEALQTDAPASIRINLQKWNPSFPTLEKVAWCENGYYMPARPTFTFDPLLHAGCYYVQEAASMFLEQVLKTFVRQPVVMLDLCAAPGGKSTLARSVLPEGSLLIANEIMRNRSQVLAENIIKWGGDSATIVTNNDSADFSEFGHLFDVVLADVPCSGEGMFRKDPNAIEEWSSDNVNLCWQRQRSIISNIWPTIKPGGLLIYSTCTYNSKENEENVKWICETLGAELLKVPTHEEWKITGSLIEEKIPVYRFLPGKTKGEGLFMAVLRKTKEDDVNEVITGNQCGNSRAKGKKQKKDNNTLSVPEQVKGWLKEQEEFVWEVNGNVILAFPQAYYAIYSLVKQRLKVITAGVEVAEAKGKDFIPSHQLAMNCNADLSYFNHEEISYEQAIAYLRKEAITLKPEMPKGYVVVTYHQQPLGFMKNIGNRANNLYPQEWRIRSGYLPEELFLPSELA